MHFETAKALHVSVHRLPKQAPIYIDIVKPFHYSCVMNTIYREGGFKISVYADHAPPHFHVRTPEGDSAVDLVRMVETAGTANRKALVKAVAWAIQNRALVEAEWKRLNGE